MSTALETPDRSIGLCPAELRGLVKPAVASYDVRTWQSPHVLVLYGRQLLFLVLWWAIYLPLSAGLGEDVSSAVYVAPLLVVWVLQFSYWRRHGGRVVVDPYGRVATWKRPWRSDGPFVTFRFAELTGVSELDGLVVKGVRLVFADTTLTIRLPIWTDPAPLASSIRAIAEFDGARLSP